MAGLTLDAGALIAFERGDRAVVALLARALTHGLAITIPAAVVGQVWRDGRRQARLARFLGAADVAVEALDDRLAREVGQLCGLRHTADIVDASVVVSARRRGDRIITGDAHDLRRLDPDAPLIVV